MRARRARVRVAPRRLPTLTPLSLSVSPTLTLTLLQSDARSSCADSSSSATIIIMKSSCEGKEVISAIEMIEVMIMITYK